MTDDARFNVEGPGPAHTKDTEDPRRGRETILWAIDDARRSGTAQSLCSEVCGAWDSRTEKSRSASRPPCCIVMSVPVPVPVPVALVESLMLWLVMLYLWNSKPTYAYMAIARPMIRSAIRYRGTQARASLYQKGRIGRVQNAPCER